MLVGKQVKLAATWWPGQDRIQLLKNGTVRGTSTGVFKMQERRPFSEEGPRAAPEEAKWLYEEMKADSKGEATKKKTALVNGWVSGSGEELCSVSCKIGGVHLKRC
jgi:hypothetical protein